MSVEQSNSVDSITIPVIDPIPKVDMNISAVASDKKPPIEYVNNKLLLEEFKLSIEKGEMNTRLARMLMLICERYGRKGSYANYSYNTDMQAFAMLNLVKSWKSFKPEKSNNPFAYFTSCVTNSFLQYLNQEKKHRNIRDALLVEYEMDPSFAYSESYVFRPDSDQFTSGSDPAAAPPDIHTESPPKSKPATKSRPYGKAKPKPTA